MADASPYFVRFDCGCIGLTPPPGVEQEQLGEALLVSCCDVDRDDPDVWIGWRNMIGKTWAPLDAAKAAAILLACQRLMADGARFQTLRSALDLPPRV